VFDGDDPVESGDVPGRVPGPVLALVVGAAVGVGDGPVGPLPFGSVALVGRSLSPEPGDGVAGVTYEPRHHEQAGVGQRGGDGDAPVHGAGGAGSGDGRRRRHS
jgi:hypothetical protein